MPNQKKDNETRTILHIGDQKTMKHKLFYTLGIIGLAMVSLATSPAKAATPIVNGPYYAPPSWDQTLPASKRFIVLSNMDSAAVLDKETGLVWEQSPSTSSFYEAQAQNHCDTLTVGNRNGWRIPTLRELASLVDPSVLSPGPTLPAGHPFSNVQTSTFYWSDSTNAGFANGVRFFNGLVVIDCRSCSYFVWCVRSGQGVDPQ
jgi:hypothetical protein